MSIPKQAEFNIKFTSGGINLVVPAFMVSLTLPCAIPEIPKSMS